MSANSPLSRIHNQLMWNRLIAVVEEQAQTLIRTAFSNTVREAGDLSAGVFDLEGRMLAQAVTGTPGHVNAMAASVGFFLEKFPVETMREGDIYITNDPWMGTGHLHDFTVVTPAFRRGRAVALFASTSHVVDVGGLGFGPDGRQVYEEGIYLPIMHLAREGVMNETLLEIVRANVREPVQVEGDFYSLGACNDTGGRAAAGDDGRVRPRRGRGARRVHHRELAQVDAERDPRLALRDLREPHADRRLRRGGGPGRDASHRRDRHRRRLRRHLARSPPTASTCRSPTPRPTPSFGARCVVGASVPNNTGSLAPVRVTAPPGCILNAPHPCAVAARHAIGQMLPDVVLGCLEPALEGQVPAEGTSCLWNPVLYAGHGIAGRAGDSTPFTVSLFHNGGTGARPRADGLSATRLPLRGAQHPGGDQRGDRADRDLGARSTGRTRAGRGATAAAPAR